MSLLNNGLALAAIAPLLLVLGCEQILGLDGFEISSDPTLDAGGGSAGTGSGGAGGTAASGGTSGSGGVAGGAVNPGDCTVVSAPAEDVVRSCVLQASCTPFVSNVNISICITLNWQSAFLGTSCIRNVQTCTDVELCQGQGFPQTECQGQTGVRCENNTAIDCTPGRSFFQRCGVRGGDCATYDSTGDMVPDSVGCEVLSTCTDSPDMTHCSGEKLYRCIDGVGIGADCTALQANCQEGASGASCLLVTPSCQDNGAACNDGKAEVCSDGSLLSYDCSSVGLSCTDEPGGPYCVGDGCNLQNVTSCEESCEGSIATACYGGVPYPIDCTSYGFGSCTMVSGVGVDPYAVCR